jgi:hypothetical protein
LRCYIEVTHPDLPLILYSSGSSGVLEKLVRPILVAPKLTY